MKSSGNSRESSLNSGIGRHLNPENNSNSAYMQIPVL
jgi:hypothetical protein